MSEVVLKGVSAAPGVVAGAAVVLDHRATRDKRVVSPTERLDEAKRAVEALRLVASDLETISGELRDAGRRDEAEIVETGVLIALDPQLTARVELLVTELGMHAADALWEAADQTALELSQVGDPTLALRADDIRSVGRRAAGRAAGTNPPASSGVLIANTLGPADVAELAPKVTGIALAGGGVTSHAAIVARSLGLPMVVGLGDGLGQVADGQEVMVDGDLGVLVASPGPERAASARAHAEAMRTARALAIERSAEPAQTMDGRRIRVLANASTIAELEEATRQGAEGVGLMRTELLFLEAAEWPSLGEQVACFRPVLERLVGRTATVRIFDFGGDKTPPFLRGIAARGVEVLLDAPDALRIHLRALLEAAEGTELRILVPMVTTADQVRAIRRILDRPAVVGAMIETPAAAENARAIARDSDFLSIGTNDLTQLVLGLDREQSRKAPVLDVRVLRLVAQAIRAGIETGIPVDVCGEAASDARAMRVMVGLGSDELSVAAARVGQVRQWIRELDFATCREESGKLLHEAGHASGERV